MNNFIYNIFLSREIVIHLNFWMQQEFSKSFNHFFFSIELIKYKKLSTVKLERKYI